MTSQEQQSGQSSWFSIGSFISAVAEKSKQDLVDVTQDMSKQFTVERDKFEAVLPWEQPNIGNLQEECKQEVFKLSEDEKIFRTPPPDGVYTDFDLLKRSQLAFRLCEEDTRLRDRSLKMIRRTDMNENDFWRNYFYRVDIIVASCVEKARMLYNQSNKDINSENNVNSNTNSNYNYNQPLQQQQQQQQQQHQQQQIPISPQINITQNQNYLPQVINTQQQQSIQQQPPQATVIQSPTLNKTTIKTTETLHLEPVVVEPLASEEQPSNEDNNKPAGTDDFIDDDDDGDDDLDDDELNELLGDASSGDDDDGDDVNVDDLINDD